MKGNITMSAKEAEKITVMDNLLAKRIKQKHAASQLRISIRQVRRIMKRYKKEGKGGLIHKSRGMTSNRSLVTRTLKCSILRTLKCSRVKV